MAKTMKPKKPGKAKAKTGAKTGKAAGAAGRKAPGAKGNRLPKQIAGVKVPKELRGPGGRLLDAINNPVVIDAAAAALAAAATSLAGNLAKGAGGAAGAAGAAGPRPTSDLGVILTATAIEGVRRLGEAANRSRADKDRPARD